MVDGESTSTTFANLSGFVSEEHLDVALRNLHNQCTSHGPLDVTVSLTNGGHTLTIRRYLQPTNEVDLGVVDDSRASDDQDEMPTEIDEVLGFGVALRLLSSDKWSGSYVHEEGRTACGDRLRNYAFSVLPGPGPSFLFCGSDCGERSGH